jgi:TorA maturation chaperone TorD
MKGPLPKPEELLALSRLFSYPHQWPQAGDLALLGPEPDRTWPGPGEPAGLVGLQSRYVALFINALPQVPCPPYGSCYLEGTLMGQSTVAIARLYRDYGLETPEMPDHLAVELEFLAFLTHPASRARPEDVRLLWGHIQDWTPEFFRRVEEHDREGFYDRLARLAGRRLLGSERAAA